MQKPFNLYKYTEVYSCSFCSCCCFLLFFFVVSFFVCKVNANILYLNLFIKKAFSSHVFPHRDIILQNTHFCLTFLILRRTKKKLPFIWMVNSFEMKFTTISTHLSIDMENLCTGIVWVSVHNELNFPIENQLTFRTIQFDSVIWHQLK